MKHAVKHIDHFVESVDRPTLKSGAVEVHT
jgi:hypothetical protein